MLRRQLFHKKGIELTFNWIFAIIAGGMIFLFLGYFAAQNTDLFGKMTSVRVSEELNIAFSGLKTGVVDTKIGFDKDEFSWILDYFRDNIDDIIETKNIDILAEVGLCFKLCKVKDEILEKIKKVILDSFDVNLGYIPRKSGSLEDSEHTNIIAYLFLHDFKKLYRGPDLSELM